MWTNIMNGFKNINWGTVGKHALIGAAVGATYSVTSQVVAFARAPQISQMPTAPVATPVANATKIAA